ncbi:NAD(P)-dependent oxidoreductase [uncultured Pseudokineococcus sp.]|uniref:NAD(P)-dependent oxidoreductase n=1 Tax=uncultured Pseudokineococcus sp. TaxID=1642928 RepID=UPI00262A8CC4|nr:NAD(P)-dependent oxidoreductase [uncultured Pseudokineococcus sp.]
MSEAAPSPAPVAILGAGLLGAAMAARLGEQGHDVRLWNRSPERAAQAADGADGVRAVADLAEAVDGAAVVLTVLRDGDAVADVAGRFLPLLGDGPVWVQASTVGPRAAGELRAQADAAGAAFLDAPVSGSTDPARRGALTWLVAGDAAVLDRARPVLDDLGQRVQHVGEAEEASALKLVVNAWMTGATAVMADALALAERLGTDPGALREVLDGGPLGMPYALGKAAMMTSGEYPAGFPAELALKDLDLAADGGALPGALEPVRERLRAVADGGRGREDVAVLAEAPPAQG